MDISDEVIPWRRCATLLTREPTRRLVFFNILLRELRKVNHYMNPIPSMKLTIIVNKYTSSLSAIIGGLAEDTKMAAKYCRTNTTHNLCTPRRDAMIMKESRCELINSAKPEKGTPKSIRVGYTLSAYLSVFFLFSLFANETRGNFLIYTVQRLFVFL